MFLKKGYIYMNYQELFTFENLYKAHKKARLSKRYKKEVIEFELNLGSNNYVVNTILFGP